MREHTGGIGRYQFLAGCNLFRHKEVNRKGDRISAEEFIRVAQYKFGMKLELDEALSLFDFLVPGTGESIEIAEMVRGPLKKRRTFEAVPYSALGANINITRYSC